MGRYKFGVESDSCFDCGDKEVDRDWRDRDEFGWVLELGCVVVRVEYGDFVVVWEVEGFEVFVGLLVVVEGWGYVVEVDVGVGDELEGWLLVCFDWVMGFNVVVYCWGV